MTFDNFRIIVGFFSLLSINAAAESDLTSISVRDPFARPDVMDVMNTDEGIGRGDHGSDFSLRGLVSGNGKAYALVQNGAGGEFYLSQGDELGGLGEVVAIVARKGVMFRAADGAEVTLKMPRRQ